MKDSADIGSRNEPFVDDWLIERMQGVSLVLHPPAKREVVLVADRPWEGGNSAYYTAMQAGSGVRLYYRGYCPDDGSEDQATCLAESGDGIHFTRPALGLYPFPGAPDNNIVYRGALSHNFTPFLDANPGADPAARYKALAGTSGLHALGSPDGIHWHLLSPEPVITRGAFDSLNTAFWDAAARCYRSYSRYWTGGGWEGVRAIQSCTSEDFLHWTDPQPNAYAGDAPLEHFYTNAAAPCPGAPHVYLSFPMRFMPERKKVPDHAWEGVSDAVFMSSRDGVRWDRRFAEAWVRPGPDPRNWTQRSNMPAWGIVQLDPGEFTMYISEHYSWNDNRLRRMTVRRHGFASVHADRAGGEFVTRPITFAGRSLILNYATSAAGSVQVEVQDDASRALPGYALDDMPPLYGDELDRAATWASGADLSALQGQPVRLRFRLSDADLFALRFA